MAVLESAELGQVEYREEDLWSFPEGLPAFEHLHRFLAVRRATFHPLMVLCSVDDPAVRFICAPVELLDPDYQLQLAPEDCPSLEWVAEGEPEAKLYVVLSFPEQGSPTANLLAPIVVNARRGIGAQVVLAGSSYPVRYPLPGMRGDEQ